MQGGLARPKQKVMYRNVIMPAITYGSPVWWEAICLYCHLKSHFVSLQRAVLHLLGGVQDDTKEGTLSAHESTADQLELERTNAEFELLIKREPIRYEQQSMRPDRVLTTLDDWQEHPAAQCGFHFLRLTRDDAQRITRLPGTHVYTNGCYTDCLAGVARFVLEPRERFGAASPHCINFKHYEHLYETEEKAQLKVVPKLTASHVSPGKLEKMNVRLATQGNCTGDQEQVLVTVEESLNVKKLAAFAERQARQDKLAGIVKRIQLKEHSEGDTLQHSYCRPAAMDAVLYHLGGLHCEKG
ncbi:hypothetical protein MRX96_050844 [Rhipicephalus microplus]